MVYCSGLESQCRNPQETEENAQICHNCGAPLAMFTQGSADADDARVGTNLSELAFKGQTAFLLSCSAALDFDRDAPVSPQQRRPTLMTYYIGGRTGPIKIGSARDVYTRLVILQAGNPEQLFIYATEPGGFSVERQRHHRFSKSRLMGEWFARTDELLRHIIHLQNVERSRFKEQANG